MASRAYIRKMDNWVSALVAAQASTIAELRAKAAVYQLIPNDELADSMASDLMDFKGA